MNEEKIEKLKKDFPDDRYNVTTKDGRVVINEKKAVLWIPKRFTKDFTDANAKKLSGYLEDLLKNVNINPEHFEVEQKAITLKCSKILTNKAKECNCTKIALITALFDSDD